MLCRWWRQLRALHRTSVNDRSFYDAIPLTFKFVLRMSTLSLLKLFVRFKLFTSPASDLHLGTDEKFFDCVCLSCLQDNSADATKKHLFEDSYRSAEWNRMSGELETRLKQWVLEPEKKLNAFERWVWKRFSSWVDELTPYSPLLFKQNEQYLLTIELLRFRQLEITTCVFIRQITDG